MIFSASCSNGKVKIGSDEITDCIILSNGVAESEGVVILDDIYTFYVPNTTPDIEKHYDDTTSPLLDLIDDLLTALNTLGSGLSGVTETSAVGATLTANMASIIPQLSPIQSKTEENRGKLC